jgi:hypothetical protein
MSIDPAAGRSATFPSADWLATLRSRGTSPAFADARAALDERVEGYHRVLPDLPSRQAGYYHEFFCPRHAVQLIFNPRDGHRHGCPVDGEVFTGEPFDSAWGWSVNDALSDAALRTAVRLALGSAAGRRHADAELVRHVLLGYAERYRTMPPAPQGHPDQYSGIVCWSALDESVWIIRLVWAAALARDELTLDQHHFLRVGLFQPALNQLMSVRYQQIQNVGNWDRGAILALGLILEDEASITEAIDGEYGIRDQLRRGVTGDGLWWELSLSYHFYVLGAVSWTMRAFRASGRTFDREDVVRRMFEAPLDLAFPDTTLPATNDCWYHIGLTGEVGHGIPNAYGFYEMAFGWFGNAMFAWVVEENRRRSGSRSTLEGLLDGALEVPLVKRAETPSREFATSGLAMLRTGAGDDGLAVLLKASLDDGDSHGHADQLAVTLFGGGRRIAIDPGTPGYGIALNDTWYRQTAAHSTVLLDSRSQPPTAGRLLTYDPASAAAEVSWPELSAWEAVTARATQIGAPDRDPWPGYAGARMRRDIRVNPGLLHDRFDVTTVDDTERAIDWVFHVTGIFDGATEPAPMALVGPCGYDVLTDVRRIVGKPAELPFRSAAGNVLVRLEPMPGEQLFVATAPGNPAADTHSVLVRRRVARSTAFVATIAPA